MRTLFVTAVAAVALGVSGSGYARTSQRALPLFTVVPHNVPWHQGAVHPGAQLTQWNGSFVDQTNATITYTMVGTDPSSTNVTTTTPVVIVPVKMVYGIANGKMTFDPKTTRLTNGRTVLRNTLLSPLFAKAVDYVQGGVNLGKTQYVDAFQRGNFWSLVQTNSNYHVLLGAPKVESEITYKVEPGLGEVMNNPFGSGKVGTMDVDVFDQEVQMWIKKYSDINPGVLPIFLTYDIYLTQETQCCIGGYHSSTAGQPSGQTYSYATYVDSVGAFSQDVSALSHELGEWEDDPFVDNSVNCTDNSLMEVGDPLETGPNYGAYPYTFKGFTYNLQSLVFIGYFGAPPSTSVNSWLAFQNDESNICPGQ